MVAYEETGLHKIIYKLPSGLYVAGDAAYIVTEHLLVPFTALAGKISTRIVTISTCRN
jgi:hypothetical protein